MMKADHEVDRYLTLLGNKIRQRRFTQLQIQEVLGWGKSYISQLMTKQKALRIQQVLAILGVIGVDPAEFFLELYGAAPSQAPPRPRVREAELRRRLEDFRGTLHSLVELLLEKELISAEDLSAAVESVGRDRSAADA